MKTRVIVLLIMVAGIMGCSDDGYFEETEPVITYEVFNNATLEITELEYDTIVNIVPGNNRVFSYWFRDEGGLRVIDDELYETIVFEIDPELTEFSFSDQDFHQINAYFGRTCYCGNYGYYVIDNGTIKGGQLNERQWLVAIEVGVLLWGGEYRIEVGGLFGVVGLEI